MPRIFAFASRASLALTITALACHAPSEAAHEGAAPAAGAEQARADAPLREPLTVENVGLSTPESALYDSGADEYIVSNIDGGALDADDRAFISRIRPDGTVKALKWIDSAARDVELDAPKGMAIIDDVLYVADLTQIRKFDRQSGKPLGSIKIEGSTFLNDLSASDDGTLFASDSGLSAGFASSGTDAVYRIDHAGRVTALAKGPELGHPNGLLAEGDGVWVASFGSGELYRLDAQGKRLDAQTLVKGSLDGIVRSGKRLFVSSWEGSSVFASTPEGVTELVGGLDSPADIGLDSKRGRLLIPLFSRNALVIYPL